MLFPEARWQSGYAAACKAVYAGSIPTLASIHMGMRPMKERGGITGRTLPLIELMSCDGLAVTVCLPPCVAISG